MIRTFLFASAAVLTVGFAAAAHAEDSKTTQNDAKMERPS